MSQNVCIAFFTKIGNYKAQSEFNLILRNAAHIISKISKKKFT